MSRRAHAAGGGLLEGAFQDQLVGLARFYGWTRLFHAPQQGAGGRAFRQYPEGRGFPDLVLLRDVELLFAELKTNKGRVSVEQAGWLEDLGLLAAGIVELRTAVGAALDALGAPTVEVYLWRPADFDAAHARLARGRHRQEPTYR